MRRHLARYLTSLVPATHFTERERGSVDINFHLGGQLQKNYPFQSINRELQGCAGTSEAREEA